MNEMDNLKEQILYNSAKFQNEVKFNQIAIIH